MYERLLERHGAELSPRRARRTRSGASASRCRRAGRARQGRRLPARGGGRRPGAAPSRCRPSRASTSRRATGRSSSAPSAAASRSRSAPSASTCCSRSATPSSRSSNDRARASKTYVAALEERPDDRKLLTKLMQLYSEEKDWAKLVEVVLRLADFVEDPKQRAKYMHTAAIVSSRQLGEIDQALAFYDRAHRVRPDAHEGDATRPSSCGGRRATTTASRSSSRRSSSRRSRRRTARSIVQVLDQLGELYRKFLNEPELAIDAYEAAQAFDPEGRSAPRRSRSSTRATSTQYLDKAVKRAGADPARATRTAWRATSSCGASTPRRASRTPRGASARRSRC